MKIRRLSPLSRAMPGCTLLALSILCIVPQFACKSTMDVLNPNVLMPSDAFLRPPGIFDPRREFGYLGTETVTVPATASIFLAGAEDGTIIANTELEGIFDITPDNSPVEVLEGLIDGGETLDIYATGEARHVPIASISIEPRGGNQRIEAGPIRGIEAVEGPLGALVGLFDNQREPFIIGQRKQINVPRGARKLYLGFHDYPGSSADNEGVYYVSIEILRR